MNRRTKRLILGAGTAAAGAVAVKAAYDIAIDKLVDAATSRKIPKIMEKSSKKSGEEQTYKKMPEVIKGREYLKNCGCTEVETVSSDGLRLVGHWYCPDKPKRVIIAMHGWRSSWIGDFGAVAEFWHNNNCAVLYAEQRGQGNSDGEYIGFGLLERYDCLEWIKWVNEQVKLPVYLAGVSMGASTVLMTAGFDLPNNVCGIMADCGFTSPKAIWKYVVENNIHMPYRLYDRAVDDACRRKIQYEADGYSCTEALQKCKVPVLFVHGTDDKFVPVEMTYENYKACASEKRLFIVPGAEHGMSYMVDTVGYQKEVLCFWKEHDKAVE